MPVKFRFQWIPLIATLLAVALGISLGNWQMRRAAEKETIERKISASELAPPVTLQATPTTIENLEYKRVLIRGEFDRDWPIYLENRPYQSRTGFYVFMPFKIADSSMHVLIARGWVPSDITDRTKLPALETPAGTVELIGIATRHPSHVLQLGHAGALQPNAILQNMEIADLAVASKLTLQPFVIEQSSDTKDGLVRDWPRFSIGIDRHHGYAATWYGLAATAFLFFVVTGIRREPNRESK